MAQFFSIHSDNPHLRLIRQAVSIIRSGGIIVYPTDSCYALGCQLENKQALERICKIRRIDDKHNFTLLCRDLSELSLYARVDNVAFRLLKAHTPGAYTFIFKATKEVPKRLMNAKRKTIGIRVPDNKIALDLLEAMGEPLMSTSLILPGNETTESDPEEIRDSLEHAVDVILNGGYLGEQPTTVIDFSDDDAVILRRGAGDPAPFE